MVVASYRQSFFAPEQSDRHGVKLASVRSGNVIGGGDWARDRIVPDIVRSLVAGRDIGVRNPHTVRPWQHVLEPLAGYLTWGPPCSPRTIRRFAAPGILGRAPKTTPPSRTWSPRSAEPGAQGRWVDNSDPAQPHETKTLRLSIEKALLGLDWRPVWHFQEAVRRTAAWYQEFYSRAGGNMRSACLRDIEAYGEQAARQTANRYVSMRCPTHCEPLHKGVHSTAMRGLHVLRHRRATDLAVARARVSMHRRKLLLATISEGSRHAAALTSSREVAALALLR